MNWQSSLKSPRHFWQQQRDYTEEEREAADNRIIRTIEAAGLFGIPITVVHPNTYLKDGNYSRSLSLKREYERLSRFGMIATKHDVSIAIENMVDNRTTRRFGGCHEDLLDLIALLGDDKQFCVCWDTGHANLNKISQPTAIRDLGEHLKALHINDNHGLTDEHSVPFTGTVEWMPIMQALHEINYGGTFNLEVQHFSDGYPPAFHLRALKFAKETAEYMLKM